MSDISEQLRDCVNRDDLPDWKLVLAAADRIEMLESMLRRIMGMHHDGGIDDLEARDDATYRNVCIALEVKDD